MEIPYKNIIAYQDNLIYLTLGVVYLNTSKIQLIQIPRQVPSSFEEWVGKWGISWNFNVEQSGFSRN